MLSRPSCVRACHFARILMLFLAGAIAVACGAPPVEEDERPLREVTIPAGTVLSLRMTTPTWSDTSRANDPVSADLLDVVKIESWPVLPIGTTVSGVVTSAHGTGRVNGRAHVTIQFTSLQAGGARYDISTEAFSKASAVAPAPDQDVRIGLGSDMTTRLTAPLTVHVATGD